MIEFNCQCSCGKLLSLSVPSLELADLQMAISAEGWNAGEILVDTNGQRHAMPRCSVQCHNHDMLDAFSRRGGDRIHWWKKSHGFDGEPPICTCSLQENDEGLLVEQLDPSCPWHLWLARWRQGRDAEERALFELWKDIPAGTLVRERMRKHVIIKSRGQGHTVGPAKIVKWSFGGGCTAMIPVDEWRPHPCLRDLEIVIPTTKERT